MCARGTHQGVPCLGGMNTARCVGGMCVAAREMNVAMTSTCVHCELVLNQQCNNNAQYQKAAARHLDLQAFPSMHIRPPFHALVTAIAIRKLQVGWYT